MLEGQLGIWRETGGMGKTRNSYSSHVPVEVRRWDPQHRWRTGLKQKSCLLITGKQKRLRRKQIKFEGGGRNVRN